MIKINLLPKKPRRKSLQYDLYMLIILLVINLLVLSGLYYKNHSDIAAYNTLIENTKKEIAGLDKIYKEYLKLEREKKEISRRLQAIDKIKEGRALAARTLYDLSTIVTDNMWLKRLTKKDNKFEIEGRSLENESISDFVEKISKLSYITNVELQNVQTVNEEGLVLKKFTITGNISL